MLSLAPSPMRPLHTSMAGVSRVSPVSCRHEVVLDKISRLGMACMCEQVYHKHMAKCAVADAARLFHSELLQWELQQAPS